MAEKVVRGKIISSDGKVLAQTLTENGSEIRDYPYGRMFAHVVGYNDKGKSGLESVCNFDLLKSDANLMTQITSSLKGEIQLETCPYQSKCQHQERSWD